MSDGQTVRDGSSGENQLMVEASQQVQPLLLAGADSDRRVGVRDGTDRMEGDFVLDRQAELSKKPLTPSTARYSPMTVTAGRSFRSIIRDILYWEASASFSAISAWRAGLIFRPRASAIFWSQSNVPFPAVGRARDDWGSEAGFQHLGRREPLFPAGRGLRPRRPSARSFRCPSRRRGRHRFSARTPHPAAVPAPAGRTAPDRNPSRSDEVDGVRLGFRFIHRQLLHQQFVGLGQADRVVPPEAALFKGDEFGGDLLLHIAADALDVGADDRRHRRGDDQRSPSGRNCGRSRRSPFPNGRRPP